MCRLYGQISLRPRTARDYLLDAEHSLFKQSFCRKDYPQKDGWGIGCYLRPSGATVNKSEKPLFHERRRFELLAERSSSRILIAHIRAASNPRNLPRRLLIGKQNSQPFSYGPLLFAHNGTLNIPQEVRKHLGPYRKRVRGFNDSEIYFWHLVKFWKRHRSIPIALRESLRELQNIWSRCKKRYPKKKQPTTGLNTFLSDGKKLYAFCHYTSPGKKSLCTRNHSWGQLCWSRKGDRVLVASEPMDGKSAWLKIPQGQLLEIRPQARGFFSRLHRIVS